MLKKKYLVSILVVLAIFLLCFIWFKKQTSSYVTPTFGPIVESVYGIGTVTARKTYQLKLGITATLDHLYVEEGQFVAAGAPLVDLDSKMKFTAPFSGTVTSLPFKVGESIFPQVPILTLMDLKDLYVVVSLEQQGALRISKGQPVKLSFESLRGQKNSGVVRSLFPNNGEFFAHIDVENLPPAILPGMTADVAIEVGRKEKALLVPVSSISSGHVVVKRNGLKKKVPVQVGIIDGEMAEIISGDLTPEDQIQISEKRGQ
ncbi:MAG: efflux RND transporter periplasmic adaptor subunit [Deltaproteobacteria bacterium]|nr:MAG: efflux RND transporter periplasmic adaptor subunit [Deltaproteobacteria bacterium]